MNPPQTDQLPDPIRVLARITAIMRREGGVRNIPDTELRWMATEQGGEAIRIWHAFENAVDLFDSGISVDMFHEQGRETGLL